MGWYQRRVQVRTDSSDIMYADGIPQELKLRMDLVPSWESSNGQSVSIASGASVARSQIRQHMVTLSRDDNAGLHTFTETGFTWALCNDNQQSGYDRQKNNFSPIVDAESDFGLCPDLKYYFEDLPDDELPDLPESPLSTHSVNRFEPFLKFIDDKALDIERTSRTARWNKTAGILTNAQWGQLVVTTQRQHGMVLLSK